MRTLDKLNRVGRRGFLAGTGALALLTSALPSTTPAVAAGLKHVPAKAAPTVLKVLRDLYPHDRLADADYQRALATIDAGLTVEQGKMIAGGAAALDAAARKAYGRPYPAVEKEGDRVVLLKGIETTPFFKTLRAAMITALYNQPEVWAKLGYEGPSAPKGGYIHRGFDDLDWLENI